MCLLLRFSWNSILFSRLVESFISCELINYISISLISLSFSNNYIYYVINILNVKTYFETFYNIFKKIIY